MGKNRKDKDEDKIDPAEVAKLPTYEPNKTPYDKATEKVAQNPAPDYYDKPLKNGPWGGLYDE